MSEGQTSSAVDALVGTIVADRYRVEKRLGEGGMGIVYLAKHVVLDKMVALKILIGEFAHKEDLVERFLHEAKASARIRHEHVVDVTDFGRTPDGNVFFCMELMEGIELADELRANGPLIWPRAKSIVLQIAAALQAAHQVGVVHRDLKPENVFLITRHGTPDYVKVLDFGIAKLTEVGETGGKKLTKTGMIFGTPDYMAPEQARGEKADHRVDVYALGCILFELVTGKTPYPGDTFMAVLTKHLFEPVPRGSTVSGRSDLPPELDAVIEKAMAKDREARYATMNDFAHAIDALDEVTGVAYTPPTSWTEQRTAVARPQSTGVSKAVRARTSTGAVGGPRSKALVWGGAAAVAVAAAGILATRGGQAERTPTPEASARAAPAGTARPVVPAPVVAPVLKPDATVEVPSPTSADPRRPARDRKNPGRDPVEPGAKAATAPKPDAAKAEPKPEGSRTEPKPSRTGPAEPERDPEPTPPKKEPRPAPDETAPRKPGDLKDPFAQ